MMQELTQLTAEQAEQFGVTDELRISLNNMIQTVVQQHEQIKQLQTDTENLIARIEAIEAK